MIQTACRLIQLILSFRTIHLSNLDARDGAPTHMTSSPNTIYAIPFLPTLTSFHAIIASRVFLMHVEFLVLFRKTVSDNLRFQSFALITGIFTEVILNTI